MVICALFLSCLAAIGLYVGHICLPVMGYGKLLWFPEGPHMAWQTLPVEGLGFRLFSIKEKQGCNSNQRQVAKTQKLVQMGFISELVSSVTQLCPTLCDPMNHSTPGLPVHHQLPEFTQTHVHRVSDTIQPSHPLSSPSPP